MSNTATITADGNTTHIHTPISCLLDAMIEAQNQVGQITWNKITHHRAAGTYRSTNGSELAITVTDASTQD